MGTSQGGVLSPLLMNIALHGMEKHVIKEFSRNEVKVIRYADDFVVFGKTLENVQKAEKLISGFLKPIGLNLSEEKTRIGHSMREMSGTTGSIGLDFLSYNFQNIHCSKHRGVKNSRGVPQNFKLITRPSREAVARQKSALSQTLLKYKGAPIGRVMERLSSRIKGWTFGYLDKKGKSFILDRHDKTKVRKFVKIKPGSSIYDGQLVYFAKRMSLENPRIKFLRNLFKKQKYLCSYCKLHLLPDEIVELHHHLDSNGKRNGKVTF